MLYAIIKGYSQEYFQPKSAEKGKNIKARAKDNILIYKKREYRDLI